MTGNRAARRLGTALGVVVALSYGRCAWARQDEAPSIPAPDKAIQEKIRELEEIVTARAKKQQDDEEMTREYSARRRAMPVQRRGAEGGADRDRAGSERSIAELEAQLAEARKAQEAALRRARDPNDPAIQSRLRQVEDLKQKLAELRRDREMQEQRRQLSPAGQEHRHKLSTLQREAEILGAQLMGKEAEIQAAEAQFRLLALTLERDHIPTVQEIEEQLDLYRQRLREVNALRAPDGTAAPRGERTQRPQPDAKTDAEPDEKTKAILDQLEKPFSMPFQNETPLEDVLKYIRIATTCPALPQGIPIYVDPHGLQAAEKALSSPVVLKLEGVKLKKALKLLLEQFDLAFTVKDGLLRITAKSIYLLKIAQLRREAAILEAQLAIKRAEIQKAEAEFRLSQLQAGGEREASRQDAIRRGMLTIEDVQRAAVPFPDTITIEFPATSRFGQPEEKRRSAPDATSERVRDDGKPVEPDAKTKAIMEWLNKPVTMAFPDETPLEDVLKYIKTATVSPELPSGIPIYVDPEGLRTAGVSLESRVQLKLEGVQLKKSLRLLLTQVGLTYSVNDGLMTISAKKADDQKPEAPKP